MKFLIPETILCLDTTHKPPDGSVFLPPIHTFPRCICCFPERFHNFWSASAFLQRVLDFSGLHWIFSGVCPFFSGVCLLFSKECLLFSELCWPLSGVGFFFPECTIFSRSMLAILRSAPIFLQSAVFFPGVSWFFSRVCFRSVLIYPASSSVTRQPGS